MNGLKALPGCALLSLVCMFVSGCAGDFLLEDPAWGGPVLGTDDAADDVSDDDDLDVSALVDIHHLLDDDDLEGGHLFTVERVQAFLDLKGSALATFTDPTTRGSAAEIVVTAGNSWGISPLYLLARIQAESGLVGSGSVEHLDKAAGCGCPDGTECSAREKGFGQQAECAAQKIRGYLDAIDARGATISGFALNTSRITLDPCEVVPENRATAALYTYTPWVGAYGEQCQARLDVGGSTLLARVYQRFAREMESL